MKGRYRKFTKIATKQIMNKGNTLAKEAAKFCHNEGCSSATLSRCPENCLCGAKEKLGLNTAIVWISGHLMDDIINILDSINNNIDGQRDNPRYKAYDLNMLDMNYEVGVLDEVYNDLTAMRRVLALHNKKHEKELNILNNIIKISDRARNTVETWRYRNQPILKHNNKLYMAGEDD